MMVWGTAKSLESPADYSHQERRVASFSKDGGPSLSPRRRLTSGFYRFHPLPQKPPKTQSGPGEVDLITKGACGG